ncbi:MAG TPA: hypothetical protein PK156_39160 [Polyangium sp.]|nr:hypothetical protein [Polyangium sp.]
MHPLLRVHHEFRKANRQTLVFRQVGQTQSRQVKLHVPQKLHEKSNCALHPAKHIVDEPFENFSRRHAKTPKQHPNPIPKSHQRRDIMIIRLVFPNLHDVEFPQTSIRTHPHFDIHRT